MVNRYSFAVVVIIPCILILNCYVNCIGEHLRKTVGRSGT